jgi:hypothetical protein
MKCELVLKLTMVRTWWLVLNHSDKHHRKKSGKLASFRKCHYIKNLRQKVIQLCKKLINKYFKFAALFFFSGITLMRCACPSCSHTHNQWNTALQMQWVHIAHALHAKYNTANWIIHINNCNIILTIVAPVLLVLSTVCIVQFCIKNEYISLHITCVI